MHHRLPNLLTSLAIGITFAGAALVLIGGEAKAKVATMPVTFEKAAFVAPNPKVLALFEKANSKEEAVDISRTLDEVRELIARNEIRNGPDYAYAAAVMAKGDSLEDALLAHDLAVCALSLGIIEVKTLVAVSQDRILSEMGRKQRFGTLAREDKLKAVDAEVSDSMRFILGVPSLREAKKLAATGKAFKPSLSLKLIPQRDIAMTAVPEQMVK